MSSQTFLIYNLVLLVLTIIPPLVLLPIIIPAFIVGNLVFLYLYVKGVYDDKGSWGATAQYIWDQLGSFFGNFGSIINPSSPPYFTGHLLTTDECLKASEMCISGKSTTVNGECYCVSELENIEESVGDALSNISLSNIESTISNTISNVENKIAGVESDVITTISQSNTVSNQNTNTNTNTPPYDSNYKLSTDECPQFGTVCKSQTRYYVGDDCYCG